MKLSIEFTSHLHFLIEGHIDCLPQSISEDFSFFEFVLPHVAIEFHHGWKDLDVGMSLYVDFLYFFNDDIDVVCGLNCLIIGGVYLVVIF